jgi:hypothetical protein
VGLKQPPAGWRGFLVFLATRWRLWLHGVGFRERPAEQIPPEELLRVELTWSAGVSLGIVDPPRAAALQAQNLLLALRVGEPARAARGLAVAAIYDAALAGWPGRHHIQKRLDGLAELARRTDNPHAQGMTDLARGVAAFYQGGWKDSVSHLRRAETIFRQRCTGAWWELYVCQLFYLYSYSVVDPAEMRCGVPAVFEETRERGGLQLAFHASLYGKPYILLLDDRPETAQHELTALSEQWPRRGFLVQHYHAFTAQLMIDLYQGDGTAAWEHVRQRWAALEGSGLLYVQVIRIWMRHFRAASALAAAVAGPAHRHLWREARSDARRLERERTPWATGFARLIQGGIADVLGDRSGAVARLREAEAVLTETELVVWAAAAKRRLGLVVGGEEGARLVAQSDQRFQELTIANPARVMEMMTPGYSP